MDFSIILLLPFSALVAFVAVLAFAVLKRPWPRLAWPFLLSLLAATPVFAGWPWENPVWLLSLMIVAIWAAIGTVVGGLLAFLLIAVGGLIRR